MLEPLTLPALRRLHASGYFRPAEPVRIVPVPNSHEHESEESCIVYSSRQFRGLKHTPYGFAVAM